MTGTGRLIRLHLRTGRVSLALWVLVIGLLPVVFASAFRGLYPTAAGRESFYEATARIPAQLAMVGPIFGSDLGALVAWRAGVLLTLAPLAAVLIVVRHTRSDEDAGRTELMGSTAVGRHAVLTSALVVAIGTVGAAAAVASISLVAMGFTVAGSTAFGLAIVAAGAVFAGIAAVAANIGSDARLARGLALSVLAGAFTLRAVGDAGSGTLSWLSWLSPIGWAAQMRPFADERWWVLALSATTAAAAIASAFVLASRRDLGSGLLAECPGPATAVASLNGVFGLAWREHRGQLLAWVVGLGSVALVMGGAAGGVGDQFGDSAVVGDALASFGGTTIEESFVAAAISILGIGAAAYSVSAVLRANAYEQSGLVEPILSSGVGRVRWLSSHVLFGVCGPAVAMLVVGFAAGVPYGVVEGDIGSVLPDVLAGAMVQLPAVWVSMAAAVLLFGFVPHYANAAWGLLIGCVLLGQVGSVLGLPRLLLDLSPFTHLPRIPGESFLWLPISSLVTVAVVSTALGTIGFGRRDIRS